MIEISGIVKEYSKSVTIGPIDLTIPTGGVTALVGPNGAGKSTLLTIIGRLLSADAGSVRVGGNDIRETSSQELAKIMAVLRQENHFITRLTVRQLVAFGRFPHSKGRLNREDEKVINRSIEFFGLEELQHRFLDQLSGGQRQRAYVAMVLCQDTDYVLLDEPLNNLDIRNSVQMMRHLRKAADELGRTIIVVLHDINFAARYSDRIVAMKDGKVVEFGTPAEIMVSDTLTRVFDTPVDTLVDAGGPLAVYY